VKHEIHIVYMIGFMGSGKTTTGKKLASLLGWKFEDLDLLIEGKLQLTIPEIFEVHGEKFFRNLESELLRNLNPGENTIVSTGGGTPCFRDNMDFMNKNGITVYLQLNPGQLKSRLISGREKRPLLKNLDDKGLLDFITVKLAEREGVYLMSRIKVDGFNPDIRDIADQIKKSNQI
jgi:shikimate kinase